MNLEKPLLPSIACALVASTTVGIIATLYWIIGPGKLPVTLFSIWEFVWDLGFADPNSTCSIELACRASNLRELFADQMIRNHIILIVGAAMIGGAVAFIVNIAHAPLREVAQTILGNKLLYDADARRSFRRYLRKSGKIDDQGLWLTPHVQLNSNAEASGISVLGGHGSGKSGVTRALAGQILKRGGLTIINDAKGDVTAGLPQEDFILLAARSSMGWLWAIGRDITDPHAASELSIKFIPSELTGESVWPNSARSILSALIESLQQEHGLAWGWEELYQCVFQSSQRIHARLNRIKSPAAEILEFDNQGNLNKTSQSILLTLWIAALQSIRPISLLAQSVPKSRRFSISEWLSPSSCLPKTIVLQHAADYPILSTAVSGLLLEIVAGKILAPSSPNRQTAWLHLILDELHVLKHLERLPELLSVGREKGVRCIIATQDWEQIEKIYGPEDSKILDARFRIKVVCQLGICETRNRVVKDFGGQRTTVEWDFAGENKPKTRRESQVSVIEHHQLSDELGVIKKGRKLNVRVAIFGLGSPGILNIPFTSWPARRPAHVPLPPRSSQTKTRTRPSSSSFKTK
ncbi:MAG: hypothetical protein CMQ34_02765 [Gammaproteobacteria bacterium]|nr:hypothetical protein [Gammaproteobacteria bacterium]|tara:strand:+ start:2554 stop:4293 length:1740 start_codon:yes stop_codon:yes gene_type:complete